MQLASNRRTEHAFRLLGIVLALLTALGAGWLARPASGPSVAAANAAPEGPAIERALSAGLDHVPGELLVKPRHPGALSSALVLGVMARYGLEVEGEVTPGVYRLRAAASLDVEGAAAALSSVEEVAFAQPNRLYAVQRQPADEQYTNGGQWYLPQISAEQAWDVTTGSDSIIIAVLDTGVATDHPDLESKIVGGYDFYSNDSDPYDDFGHGTMTAGIAAAATDNGTGIAGVSWGARIMPVKVLGGSRGAGSDEMIARGIRYAVDNGAKIINMSLGGAETSPVQDDAIRYAHDHNVLIVAAAGNTPDGKPHYPAANDTVLSVGATGRSDTVTGFSSFGSYLDISAPGVGILSTSWEDGRNTYGYGNGTSFSCPLVAGAAALVWSANPQLTADDVRFVLEDSADDVGPPGWDEYSGKGRLNALRAVQLAQQGKPPTRTPTPASQSTSTPVPTATPGGPVPPSLQLDTREPAPGALMALIGSGYAANEIVEISVQAAGASERVLGSAQSGAQGSFRAEVALPRDVPPGKATLAATGVTSRIRVAIDITVKTGGAGGQSVVRGTIRGVDPRTVEVRLKPSLGVTGPELTTVPDANGVYSFANLASGFYSLSASGGGSLPAGPFAVQVDGSAADVKTIDITMAATRPKAFDRVTALPNSPTLTYFPEVGHTLKGPFLDFWRRNGGLAIFGYPISEEFPEVSATDGKTYTVQYFERNRFEYHPEFANTPNAVLMGLLGIEVTRGRTFPPGAPFNSNPQQVYFKETQHSLSGPFLKYWQSHGGLAIFGYPISEEIMENGYLTQYFERNRFEYHPEFANTPNEVLLGLLGVEVAQRNGWIPR